MKWPTNKEQSDYMLKRQKQNLQLCKKSKAETWMYEKLNKTPHKWTRQAQWGYRIFDFWCHTLGIAVEADGKEHNKTYDNYRDEQNFMKSGIVVLRVRNFNEEDATKALKYIESSENWNDRRIYLSLKPIKEIPIKSENCLFNIEGTGGQKPTSRKTTAILHTYQTD